MAKIKVGNKTLLISSTFFIPDGEEVEMETLTHENELLKLKLKCKSVDGQLDVPPPIIHHDQVGEYIVFRFENFTDPLGAMTNSQTVFATSKNGSAYSYFAVTCRLKGVTKIEFQVLLEGQA